MPAQAPSDDTELVGPAGTSWTSPWRVDVVLAVATAAGVTAGGALAAWGRPDAAPTWFAGSALVALVVGGLVVLRRRAPGTMLVLTAAVTVAGAVADVPAATTVLPAVAALGAAAAAGRVRAAAWTGGVVVVALAVDRAALDGALDPAAAGEGAAGAAVATGLVLDVTLVVAAVAVGIVVDLRARLRTLAAPPPTRPVTGAPEGAVPRHREHLRIAHDLHDLLAHNLTVVALHTGVASAAVGRDDDSARTALRHVRDATAATLHELRATTLVLRQDDPVPASGPGARGVPPAATGPAGLSSLVEPVRAAGVEVVTRVEVPAASIDAVVDAAAYRIVQEALATVLRHAVAERAVVRLTATDGRLRITVSDDGHGPRAADVESGAGMVAARERARALGGTLTVREVPSGGLTVVADLPTRLLESPRTPSAAVAP
ncbi:histidine kinase [Isoptericola jiangsuensis]|uniref:histidine kinase n=1 Tax=Isoptericola jiangsuensis TaxID=548579 RepID=A0A2A9ERL1_9MICO|nr:histidine kinase [Isoptericola jiangsuensis]PFG41634.1 histidine kinase [Isoptericola jiangsuensis]